jgi:hypothetical protein
VKQHSKQWWVASGSAYRKLYIGPKVGWNDAHHAFTTGCGELVYGPAPQWRLPADAPSSDVDQALAWFTEGFLGGTS